MDDLKNVTYLHAETGRGKEWSEFAQIILNHIENYTVPQYGDITTDNVSKWSVDEIMPQIERYVRRYKSNSRPGQEHLDMMKIAHYACMAYFKIDKNKEVIEKKQSSDQEIKELKQDVKVINEKLNKIIKSLTNNELFID